MCCIVILVYERKIYDTHRANFQCESCSTNTIEIIWANYGVQVQDQYPLAISTSETDCVTTEATSVMQKKCNGKTGCSFIVNEGDFLTPNCRRTTILLVRYTCNTKIPGILQAHLFVHLFNYAIRNGDGVEYTSICSLIQPAVVEDECFP
jgi:hypothetical protein